MKLSNQNGRCQCWTGQYIFDKGKHCMHMPMASLEVCVGYWLLMLFL
jgi:hypothetical protein